MASNQGNNKSTDNAGQAYPALFFLFVGGFFLIPMVLSELGYPGSFIIRAVTYFGLAIIDVILGVFAYEMYKCRQRTKRGQTT